MSENPQIDKSPYIVINKYNDDRVILDQQDVNVRAKQRGMTPKQFAEFAAKMGNAEVKNGKALFEAVKA